MGKFFGTREPKEYAKETDDQRGKDVVIDWSFEGFDTDKNLWIDSNGLDMHKKRLWERQEFKHKASKNISENFYPVQSAIAIRDKKTNL